MLGEHTANWFHYGYISFSPDVDTDTTAQTTAEKTKEKKDSINFIIVVL